MTTALKTSPLEILILGAVTPTVLAAPVAKALAIARHCIAPAIAYDLRSIYDRARSVKGDNLALAEVEI